MTQFDVNYCSVMDCDTNFPQVSLFGQRLHSRMNVRLRKIPLTGMTGRPVVSP